MNRMFCAMTSSVLLCSALMAEAEAELPRPYADEPAAGTAIVHPIDRAVMVWVPSGYFIMGEDRQGAERLAEILGVDDPDTFAAYEWYPKRREYVAGFFVDKYEVTRQRWDRFLEAADHEPAHSNGPAEKQAGEYALHPAVSITWAEAQKYANWSHKQLPTEKQWEKAARGTDGRFYPWGNEPPTAERGVFPLREDGKNIFQMVGSRPAGASPYGCMDMSGNVYEWTSEWMEPYPNNPEADRMFSYTGHQYGMLRGGSFYHAMHAVGCAKRFGFEADETYYHVGFRTVWTPPADYFSSDAYKQARKAVAEREAEIRKMREKAVKDTPYWGGG